MSLRLSKDQRTLLNAENHDQLTGRNTLLLTIYQYMDKILAVDKTPVGVIFFLSQCTLLSESFFFLRSFLSFSQKKGNQAETKPFINLSVFHDNLMTWLKALSQIQLDFDKRVKDAETKCSEKLADMRRQLDTRWKQIDKFESSVKAYGGAKATWRGKFTDKEGELEALKVSASHFILFDVRLIPSISINPSRLPTLNRRRNWRFREDRLAEAPKKPKRSCLALSMWRHARWWCTSNFC